MKLLWCPQCQDLFKLSTTPKHCSCRKCFGAYKKDWLTVMVNVYGFVIGIDNGEFSDVVTGDAGYFHGFLINQLVKNSHVELVHSMSELNRKEDT